MFTGIISGIGRVVDVRSLGSDASHGRRLTIEAPPGYLDDVQGGDSIAINGACMTVTQLDTARSRFAIDISAESLARTAGLAEPGPVNLEKALRAQDRLGGHLVSGHVDGELARFLAYKGSVALNGVSLTVNRVEDAAAHCEFSINLIPHTIAATTLGTLAAGHAVNLEIDLIARYVERMLAPAAVR